MTDTNFLSTTTQQIKPSSVNGDDNDGSSDVRVVSRPQKNFVYIAPPRTSQLERRKRVMKVDTAKVNTSAGESTIDCLNDDSEKKPSYGAFNQTSFVGSFGFGSREDLGEVRPDITSADQDDVNKDVLNLT